jgi:hypothetical protein
MSTIGSFTLSVVLNETGTPTVSQVPLLPDVTTMPFAISSSALSSNHYEVKILPERRVARLQSEIRHVRVRR